MPNKRFLDKYEIDYEAVSLLRQASPIMEKLEERVHSPRFDREVVCRKCENWTPSKLSTSSLEPFGLAGKVNTPHARDPADRCEGCVFSYLDETGGSKRSRNFIPRKKIYRRRTLKMEWDN